MTIDTGNNSLTSINPENFKNIQKKKLYASTDMIFMYNLLSNKDKRIEPIYERDIIDKDLIRNIEYPRMTQKQLHKKCIEQGFTDENLLNIGFRMVSGIGGGKKIIFNNVVIQMKIDGIDKEFEFLCDLDETIGSDILLGYSDIATLYENGIDIGFNPLILDQYRNQEYRHDFIKQFEYKINIFETMKSQFKYNSTITYENQMYAESYFLYRSKYNNFELQRFPAYKI